MLRFNISPEEMKVFMEELEELLQTFERDVVALEKEPSPSILAEMFRVAHTIKGSSGSLGHQRMAHLTHGMESLLDQLRQGKIALSRELVDLLLESLDILRLLKKEMEEGKEAPIDLDAILQEFSPYDVTLMEKKPAAPVRRISLKSIEEKLQESLSRTPPGSFIKVTFPDDCDMPVVRAFQVCLEAKKHGALSFSLPTEEQLKEGDVRLQSLLILLETSRAKDELVPLLSACPEVRQVEVRKVTKKGLSALLLEFAQSLEAQGGEPPAGEGTEPTPSSLACSRGAPPPQHPTSRVSATEAAALQEKISSVRVSVEILDTLMNLVGELVIDRTRLGQLGGMMETVAEGSSVVEDLIGTTAHMSKITTDLQDQIMKARLVPIDMIFTKIPRLVRDLSRRGGKEVNLTILGSETELDRAVIEEIGDPLIHLVRNAVDHGIEAPEVRRRSGKPSTGTVLVSANHEENYIVVKIQDDGKGIDLEGIREKGVERGIFSREESRRISESELIELIFLPGFSTAREITDVSGRGVGMDIVKTNLQKIGGVIQVESVREKGTTFTIRIPLTLAIMQSLLVSCRETIFAIPLSAIVEIVHLQRKDLRLAGGREVFVLRGEVVSLAWLLELFDRRAEEPREEVSVVVVTFAGRKVGIAVDSLIGKQEVVIKTLGLYVGDIQGVSGATVLGDGTVGLILDVASFLNVVAQSRRREVAKVL